MGDPLWVVALIYLWLLHCYKAPPIIVGAHCVRPYPWESYFSFKRGTPSPPTAKLPRGRSLLQGDPLWVAVGIAVGINLGSLCREPPELILFASGNPGDEGAPALAGGGEMVRKVTFVLKLSLRFAGSPPPSTEGGKFSVVVLNVGRGLAPADL